MTSEIARPQSQPSSGCLQEIGWLGMGFVLPCASLTFYRRAIRRRLILAVLFFLLFTLIIAGLTTVFLGRTMGEVGRELAAALAEEDFPEITIRGGTAEVDAPQPLILVNEPGTLIVLDTTGQYTELDPVRVDQGLLLTHNSVHLISDNEYQVLPLDELQAIFNRDPLVINAGTLQRAWSTFGLIFTLIAGGALVLWHMLVRFMILVTLAVIVWGVISIFRSGTSFSPILIAGIYALVPAFYLDHLIGLLGIPLPGLQTFLLLVFWGTALGLLHFLPDKDRTQQPDLRGWRAWIGLPMLITLAASGIFEWTGRALTAWLVVLGNLAVLAVIGLLTRPSSPGAAASAAFPEGKAPPDPDLPE